MMLWVKIKDNLSFKLLLWMAYIFSLLFLSLFSFDENIYLDGFALAMRLSGLTFELTIIAGILLSLFNVTFGASWFWKLIHGLMTAGVILTIMLGSWLLVWIEPVVGVFTILAGVFLIPAQLRLYYYAYKQFSYLKIEQKSTNMNLPIKYPLSEHNNLNF